MKYFTRFLNLCLFIFVLTSLAACKTMRTSEKTVSDSETATVTASRLAFYRTLDSLSRQFHLSADSIIIIFQNASTPVLPTALPSGIEGYAETPSDSQENSLMPKAPECALKIYGLHIAENSEEKSEAKAELKGSVAVATQSHKLKSAKKQKTAPPATYTWLPIILIIIFCFCMAIILIRFIHKHTFLI